MRSQKTSQLQKDLKTCEIPIDPFSKNGREFHSEMVAVQLRGRDQGRRAKRVIKHWMRKAHDESLKGATVVCLVPSRTDTRWWHDYAMRGRIEFIKGRLRFLQDGEQKDPAPAPSCVLVFTPWSEGPPAIKTIERSR